MTTQSPTRANLDQEKIRRSIDGVLQDFLARQLDAPHHEAAEMLHEFLATGGKRLRPLLCVLGWLTAAPPDSEPPEPVLRTAAALEMFHAFALIHDDIMDRSDTRRGRPSVHRRAARLHEDGRCRTEAEHLGLSAAILIGDLALVWSDELLHTAGLTPAQFSSITPILTLMRTEVMYGQYLDVTTTGRPTADLEQALRIILYKTAKYTIERPLHVGALLAGADRDFCAALSEYAIPLGEAFQLRDDLLGIFGDPATTGKPNLDDLRDGKHTALLATALQRATPDQRQTLLTAIGCEQITTNHADQLRRTIAATGAPAITEQMIETRRVKALHALDSIPAPSKIAQALAHCIDLATTRTT
jgi:geranylgeranyl diphosphate synthase type I